MSIKRIVDEAGRAIVADGPDAAEHLWEAAVDAPGGPLYAKGIASAVGVYRERFAIHLYEDSDAEISVMVSMDGPSLAAHVQGLFDLGALAIREGKVSWEILDPEDAN